MNLMKAPSITEGAFFTTSDYKIACVNIIRSSVFARLQFSNYTKFRTNPL